MNIPVLKYIDVLIGLSVVMILVSTIVMSVTQLVLNSTFARARHLQHGLRRLIAHIDPVGLRPHAAYLARLILRHPMIGQRTLFSSLREMARARRGADDAEARREHEVLPVLSPGSVVQREELAYLLIEFAADEGPLVDPLDDGVANARIIAAQSAVAQALQGSGVEDPSATLRAIRLKVVENERAAPELPAHRWRADAVSDCANSDFVGKLHATFDNTMARVSDGFTSESKRWVAGVALIVAIALQLDSFELLRKLSVDERYRETFVAVAQQLDQQQAALKTAALPSKEKDERSQIIAASADQARASLALLGAPTVDLLPKTSPLLLAPVQWAGILFSWVLLSLGAPFWFDLLKNLLKFRSLLATKDDTEREQRETGQPTPARTPVAPAAGATVALGEAGDLAATGALG